MLSTLIVIYLAASVAARPMQTRGYYPNEEVNKLAFNIVHTSLQPVELTFPLKSVSMYNYTGGKHLDYWLDFSLLKDAEVRRLKRKSKRNIPDSTKPIGKVTSMNKTKEAMTDATIQKSTELPGIQEKTMLPDEPTPGIILYIILMIGEIVLPAFGLGMSALGIYFFCKAVSVCVERVQRFYRKEKEAIYFQADTAWRKK